jgi:GNAT superfamily N-acetyltransferase
MVEATNTPSSDAQETLDLLIGAWKIFVGRLPSGTIAHADGVAALLGNVPLPFFNLCVHDGPLADHDDVRRRLTVACERAAGCPFGWMFAICEDLAPAGWTSVAAELGLTPAMHLFGMRANRLKPPRRPLPQLTYRRVQDEASARTIGEINGLAYGMPPEMVDCLCNLHLWREDSHGYVGLVDGRPVTCAATFPVDGTVYVALVATLPDEHGRGYAEAVMRHAVEHGTQATGFGRTTLHATEAGRPLYEAMGYATTATLALLSSGAEH